jgi:hypothetical protein
VNFEDVTQSGWGGRGESFYGGPRALDATSYHIGLGCNFDTAGPVAP